MPKPKPGDGNGASRLPWLKANASALGFESRFTAAKLLKAASNVPPAAHLEADAAAISRQLWGHKVRGTQGTGENEWYTPQRGDFVGWWNVNVGVRQRPPGGKSVNADLRSQLSREKAEEKTKIKQQQVSRWRNGLKRSAVADRHDAGGSWSHD